MRLLIAYGRLFAHPRPYRLLDLANAAGMFGRAGHAACLVKRARHLDPVNTAPCAA